VNFFRYDSLILATKKSTSMVLIRPFAFMFIKKMVYHGAALLSNLRHLPVTLLSTTWASMALGIGTVVMFCNSRTWTSVIVFFVADGFASGSRLWMLSGAPGKGKVFFLRWYAGYLSTGKPGAGVQVSKADLRGFEVLAMSLCICVSMTVVILLYPLGWVLGEDNIVFTLLFPHDKSIFFLCVAFVVQILQDLISQVAVERIQKMSHKKHFSATASVLIVLGILQTGALVALVMNNGWMFKLQKVGLFKET